MNATRRLVAFLVVFVGLIAGSAAPAFATILDDIRDQAPSVLKTRHD